MKTNCFIKTNNFNTVFRYCFAFVQMSSPYNPKLIIYTTIMETQEQEAEKEKKQTQKAKAHS